MYKNLPFGYNKTEPDGKVVKTMEKKTLGAFIALLRKEKGLTQKQLAELLNVSDKTVSHWECDETSPDISLLPILAQALGVTVDELLQGEKKPVQPTVEHHYIPPKSESVFDKAESLASKAVNRIKENADSDIAERYKYFRMLSLVGTAVSLVVFLRVAFAALSSGTFGTYVNFMFMPGIISLVGSLWTIAISIGFTVGARVFFSKSLYPCADASEREKEYTYKANVVCYNNIFLVICIFPVPFVSIDLLPVGANCVIVLLLLAVLRLFMTVMLNKKGIIRTGRKKLLKMKYASVFVLSALIVSGSLLFLREAWYFAPKNIIFDNSADFIAYMETPKEKPENAYLVEGVTASTYPPTTMLPTTQKAGTSSSPVVQLPETDVQEEIGETVLGLCGRDWITFKWLNKEVFDVSYNDEQGTFHVITYEAKIKQKDREILVDDGVPIVVFAFTVTDALICLFLYKNKLSKLTEA